MKPLKTPLPPKPLMSQTSSSPPSRDAISTLVPTTALPARLRRLFPYPHLNRVQSECFDLAFQRDATLIVASPTGSGKTGILELGLARMWGKANSVRPLALYVAPLKALVTERFNDWSKKTEGLGIRMVTLTGDDDDDMANEQSVARADLILTTPEKWDRCEGWRKSIFTALGSQVNVNYASLYAASQGSVVMPRVCLDDVAWF